VTFLENVNVLDDDTATTLLGDIVLGGMTFTSAGQIVLGQRWCG